MKPTMENYLIHTPMSNYMNSSISYRTEKKHSTPTLGWGADYLSTRGEAYSLLEQKTFQRERDMANLRDCALLHKFLTRKVTEHLQDKMVGEPNQKKFEDMIFDLQITKRALKLIERFYRDLGLLVENDK